MSGAPTRHTAATRSRGHPGIGTRTPTAAGSHVASHWPQTAVLRRRLRDVSWFMRCLSEAMARRANLEDRCTGWFWEGRFRWHALLDDGAALACMTYVDLNSVRDGVADTLLASPHTSIQRRLQAQPEAQVGLIRSNAGLLAVGFLPLSETDYIELVDWAGRQLRPGKRGHIANDAPPSLHRGFEAGCWLRDVRGVESRFCRAIGSVQALLDKARQMGQCWLMVRRLERVVMSPDTASVHRRLRSAARSQGVLPHQGQLYPCNERRSLNRREHYLSNRHTVRASPFHSARVRHGCGCP